MVMAHELPLAQQVASPGLIEHYMSRIWTLNGAVNAVVESCAPTTENPFPDNQASPRILETIPFLVKDTVDVLGFHTICGSPEYEENSPADNDSKLVAVLRQLGAVPIGKTNVPFHASDVQTFNEVYGTTQNPHNLELSSGGSSGGSAAAVALGLAAFAVGSDWNGSLRIPYVVDKLLMKNPVVKAAFCGVTSLRASRGRITLDGTDRVLPPMPADPHLTGSVAVSGIFTKTVMDLKFIMDALFPLLTSESHQEVEMLQRPEGSVKVGVWTTFPGVPLEEKIKDAMEALPDRLAASVIVDGGPKVTAELTLGPLLNMARLHKTLQEFTRSWDLVRKPMTNDIKKKLEVAVGVQEEEGEAVDSFLTSAGYAALITPVAAVLPHEHNYEHRPFTINGVEVPYWRSLTGYVAPFSVTGSPVVTMPLCLIDGRPCGIQVVGRRNCDEELLRVCTILERQLGHHHELAKLRSSW